MTRARQYASPPWRRVAAAIAAAVAAAAVGGCTGAEDPTVATAGGSPGAAKTADDAQAQELAFVACMREAGIADMPDPVPGDTSGRSSVRYAIDVMGKGSDPLFQTALEQCKGLLPELPAQPPSSGDHEALLAFARCMRDNGLPDFPDLGDNQILFVRPEDPRASDGFAAVTILDGAGADGQTVAVNLADPVAAAAFEACKSLFPTMPDE